MKKYCVSNFSKKQCKNQDDAQRAAPYFGGKKKTKTQNPDWLIQDPDPKQSGFESLWILSLT